MGDPIVVDFEGLAARRPMMAGVLAGGEFLQFAFTDVEPGIAMAARACGLECACFEAFCVALVERARREGRGIAGFSRHEREWIADGLGGRWPDDVAYVDAKRCAKAWRLRRHPAEAAGVHAARERMRRQGGRHGNACNRLVDFVRLRGITVPEDYGDRQVTGVLRRVLAQSANHTRFRGLTRSTREAWRRVLEHNRRDCVWARMFVSPRSSVQPRGRAGCRR